MIVSKTEYRTCPNCRKHFLLTRKGKKFCSVYGTTSAGGASDDCTFGCGTAFKITPSGTLTALYDFCSQIQATNQDFYGTTYSGGANSKNCGNGCGTVFKITPSGTLTTLYSFLPLR
jgi:uncharacterized repeat protein (TIGR03803 family)